MTIDITDCKRVISDYGGSVRKFAICYENQSYMVKLSHPDENDAVSEHLGCRIFALLGIPVQDTFLCYYTVDGSKELAVACRDFRSSFSEKLCRGDTVSKDFIRYKDARRPELHDIEKIFSRCQPYAKEDVVQRFWETFVVDALIGNRSRKLEDWGFLSSDLRNLKLAPVYDCGMSLGASCNELIMKKCLADSQLMFDTEGRILTKFRVDGKLVTYGDMLFNPPPDLAEAVKNIVPKIKLDEIYHLVDSIDELSAARKDFIKRSIAMRYEKLLLPAFEKLNGIKR